MRLLDAARVEHQQINDREGEAMVVGQLGALLMNWGRLEEARVASEEALEVFEATGHRYREGVMLTNLARIAMEQGRLDDALEGGRRALRLTEEIDDAEGVVASLQSLGDGYRLAGEHRRPGSTWSGGWRRAVGTPCRTSPRTCSPRWPRSTWSTVASTTRSRTPRRPRRPPRRTTSRTPTPAPTCSRAWCGRTSATRPPSPSCGRWPRSTPSSASRPTGWRASRCSRSPSRTPGSRARPWTSSR